MSGIVFKYRLPAAVNPVIPLLILNIAPHYTCTIIWHKKLRFLAFLTSFIIFRSQRQLNDLKSKLKASDDESEKKKVEADIEKLEKQVSKEASYKRFISITSVLIVGPPAVFVVILMLKLVTLVIISIKFCGRK